MYCQHWFFNLLTNFLNSLIKGTFSEISTLIRTLPQLLFNHIKVIRSFNFLILFKDGSLLWAYWVDNALRDSPVNNTSIRKYWKLLFYTPNTDTGTFYKISTDISTDAQYPKFDTDILVFPVFYSISILCFKPPFDSCYLRLLAL